MSVLAVEADSNRCAWGFFQVNSGVFALILFDAFNSELPYILLISKV